VRLGFDDRGDVRRQWRVLRFAALAAARGEVPQAADRVTKRVPSRRDGVASPAEASFGVAGTAVAQFGGHLGQEQSTLKSGEPSGPRPNQGVEAFDGVLPKGCSA
jgi:hypothetical protein